MYKLVVKRNTVQRYLVLSKYNHTEQREKRKEYREEERGKEEGKKRRGKRRKE